MGMRLTRIMNRYAQPGMWAAGICTVAGVICQHFLPFSLMAAVLFVLGAFLAGLPILVRAIQGLRFKTVGIECLVSIAVIGAFAIGEFIEAAVVTLPLSIRFLAGTKDDVLS